MDSTLRELRNGHLDDLIRTSDEGDTSLRSWPWKKPENPQKGAAEKFKGRLSGLGQLRAA